jgi:hypothetical protein
MTTKRIIVVSRRGKLVGTYVSRDEPASPSAPRVSLVAGPGQRLHELEVEEPETYHQTGAIAELHKLVKKRLHLK